MSQLLRVHFGLFLGNFGPFFAIFSHVIFREKSFARPSFVFAKNAKNCAALLRKENQELQKENQELRKENDELRKRLNERYHSVTASDIAKQSTNNQIRQDDQIDIIIAEDFKNMRLEQKAFWQYIDRFSLLNNFRLTIAPKYKYSIKETFMEKFSQLCADQFLPEIIDRRKELSELENVEKLAPHGGKDACWQQRSEDDFGSPIIFRHTGIWSKFMLQLVHKYDTQFSFCTHYSCTI